MLKSPLRPLTLDPRFSPLRSARRCLEAPLTRLGLLVVPRLPRRAVLGLARAFGSCACLLALHLRRVGLANLEIAFGAASSRADKRRILRRSFQSFALVVLDTLWLSRDTRSRVESLVRFDSEYSRLFQRKAQICVTGHLGNWEVMGLAFGVRGYPLASVAAPLANPAVDELFNRMRAATGQRVISVRGALRSLIRTLREGGKIALLLDQNTKPAEGGVFVDFFGLPVPIASAAAALALRTGAELFVGACVPQADGTYRALAPRRIPVPDAAGAGANAEAALTAEIARGLEELVRANPEHWLWMYKRWKYVAPGLERARYPFYAKVLPGAAGNQ
jgi:Kdo2-lipid IVA lauroyltransferase/acyltransferase